jgi:cellulose synthase/poly-beta-1,6-N-acetylglucosamine synthase-like glycosyltransferase
MRAYAIGEVKRGIAVCGAIVAFCVLLPGALGPIIWVACFCAIVAVFFAAATRIMAAIRPSSSVPVELDSSFKPKVSVLVTSKDEPADVVISSIKALRKLDYPNYEVIIINSNSSDRENYGQIERYVQSCPDNFRFVHVDKVHGFKAGALNFLNAHCVSKDSVIEAVVDCDYIVDPDFLNRTVGYFKDERVGLVQAPQDYSRVDGRNAGLYYEYRSFFSMVMHQAQRLGLVSFTGTMGLVRTSLVRRESGWNEECITEDAEAGARINREGYIGVYVDESLGKGYMPFDYGNLMRQRRRWVYGNMQVLVQNFGKVLHERSLNLRQKLAFVTQTTAWFQPELMVASLSVLSLLSWRISGVSLFAKAGVAMLNLLAICLITSLVTFFVGLRHEASLADRAKALLAHYGLLSVMSTGWLLWLVGYRMGFAVTKKVPDQHTRSSVPAGQVGLIVLLGLSVLLMPHQSVFAGGGIAAVATAILAFFSVLYTNHMFSQYEKVVEPQPVAHAVVAQSAREPRELLTQENGELR